MSRSRIVCVLLALITLSVYWPTRHYEFIACDDDEYVTGNRMVQAGLTWEGVKWAFTSRDCANWHPLTWLSHMIDCQLFGLDAGRHHLVNALFHSLNAVLVFALLLRLTGGFWQSAFIAAVFAWHPLRVTSVAWIAERKDVLCAFFGLLALFFYTGYAQRKSGRPCRASPCKAGQNPIQSARAPLDPRLWKFDYFLALMLFALGLMAKPMLVTLPFVFLLLDYWPLNRMSGGSDQLSVTSDELSVNSDMGSGGKKSLAKLPTHNSQLTTHNSPLSAHNSQPTTHDSGLPTLWRLVQEKLPFFALAAASCVVTLIAQQGAGAVASLERFGWSFRLQNAVISSAKYLFHAVWPVNLAVIYPLPKEMPWTQTAAVSAMLVVFTWLTWRVRRQRPYLLMGWLWFLGMLTPVIGLVQLGLQAMADRYTYLPLIGVLIGVTFGVGDLAAGGRLKPGILIPIAGLVLGGCLLGTAWQLRFWRNSETLLERALAVTGDNPFAHNNLGAVLMQRGRVADAAAQFQKTVDILPNDAWAHYNLGRALVQLGQLDRAIAHFQKVLEFQPENIAVLNNLAWILATCPTASLRDGIKAATLSERADQIAGGNSAAIAGTLAAAYAEIGRFDAAVAAVRRALRLASARNVTNEMNALTTQLNCYAAGTPFRDARLRRVEPSDPAKEGR